MNNVNLIRKDIEYTIEFLDEYVVKSSYNSGQRRLFVMNCIMHGNDPKNIHGTRHKVGLSLNAIRSLGNYFRSLGLHRLPGVEFIVGTDDYRRYHWLLKGFK